MNIKWPEQEVITEGTDALLLEYKVQEKELLLLQYKVQEKETPLLQYKVQELLLLEDKPSTSKSNGDATLEAEDLPVDTAVKKNSLEYAQEREDLERSKAGTPAPFAAEDSPGIPYSAKASAGYSSYKEQLPSYTEAFENYRKAAQDLHTALSLKLPSFGKVNPPADAVLKQSEKRAAWLQDPFGFPPKRSPAESA